MREEPGPERTSHAAEIGRVARLLRDVTTASTLYAERARGEVGVHRSDLGALGILSQALRDDQALTAGDLATRLGLSAPATSALLDRLEAIGHVTRQRHPDDGRKVVIHMTDTAVATGWRAFGPIQGAVSQALSDFSEQELTVAGDVLESLLGAIQSASRSVGH